MQPIVRKVLVAVSSVVLAAAAIGGAYVYRQTSAFDASLAKVYAVPLPEVKRATDDATLVRGKHIAESLGACATRDCHGADLGGGATIHLGPLGSITGPNISTAGITAAYSDAELARLIQFGIKRDGRSVRMMPVQDFCWLPDQDVAALVSYLRTVPAVTRDGGPFVLTPLAKVLDRRGLIVFDVARRVASLPRETPPAPAATAEYGRYLGRLCTGCHGEHFSGGRIPAAPPSLPIPTNITPHESGIKDWTYSDFEKLLNTGVRKSGGALDPFMPIEAVAKFDALEKKALWDYLRSLPALPSGQR